MIILKGDNLGKRQRELNIKVNEAAEQKQNFEEARIQSGDSDVDKLYLIDLASKYKNVNYIIEVFKSGNSLHISRALKCAWLYEDDLSIIINTDYLHCNIFPLMSFKMKRKFLTTISTHVTNEHRASDFYTYCWNMKLYNIALKFLIFTSESIKLKAIESSVLLSKIRNQKEDYLQFLIGKSFVLAKTFLKHSGCKRPSTLYKLRYLISVSDIEYLDMLENCEDANRISTRFGLRISKHILKNHKHRVLKNPFLYSDILNKSILTKSLTVEEAKEFAVDLLPKLERGFWDHNYCSKYEFIIEIIPEEERFKFLKKIFKGSYSNEDFEMTENFFKKECYRFMTLKEKHSWALRHVENKEIQGVGRDYKWYEFVEFETAFPEIKKYVMITPDLSKRSEIIDVLIQSAKTQREITKLLTYYYDRHINEDRHIKVDFVVALLKHHNIIHFDNYCWIALNKILHNIKIYNIQTHKLDNKICTGLEEYNRYIRFSIFVYHVINQIDIPDALKDYIDSGMPCRMRISEHNNENREVIFKFLVNFYEKKITNLDNDNICKVSKDQIIKYVHNVLELITVHQKSCDACPEIVKKYVYSDPDTFRHYAIFKHLENTDIQMLQYLKQDVTIVIDKISEIRELIINNNPLRINQFLKKLNIYFPDDVGKEYFDLFVKILSEKLCERSMLTVVYGILQLADEQFKADFLVKHAPEKAEVDREKIDTQLLYIQRSICSLACFLRPPVPLSHILMYIKGDYTKYCLPMFNSYLENLPWPQCLKFAEAFIDAPLSIQKHAIRIAYRCFKPDNFRELIIDVWNKTKNVSLRFVIYQMLYKKVLHESENMQFELFEILKSCTLNLNENDQDELYDYLICNTLPSSILSQYIEVGWQAVEKLYNSTTNVRRKTNIIENIIYKIDKLDVKFVHSVIDEHIINKIINFEIPLGVVSYELENLYMAKLKLVSTFLVYFASDKDYLEMNIKQAKYIVKTCIERWNVVHEKTFTYRKFCWKFIDNLVSEHHHNGSYEDAIPIMEAVLGILQESLPLRVTYLKLWSLRLSIFNSKAKQAGISLFNGEETEGGKIEALKKTIKSFTKEAANAIKDSVGKSSYFLTYSDDLKEMIKENIEYIKWDIDNGHLDIRRDIFLVAADCLTDIRLLETYLIAVLLLPEYSEHKLNDDLLADFSEDNWNDVLSKHNKYDLNDEYESVVNKVKSFDSEELRFFVFQKFNKDFETMSSCS